MKRSFALLRMTAVLACLASTSAWAGDLTVHVGPPSIGTGGTNPLSIPPVNPIEYEFVYVTDKDSEWTLGITPGMFYGARSRLTSGTYVGFGGGLVIGANGTGPGMYSCIGATFEL